VSEKKLLTLAELDREYGIDPRTARKLAVEDEFPLYRIGGRRVVIVDDLLAWLRARPFATTNESLDKRIERQLG